ncbi:hypothetical protein HGRIS_001439 [Hohenbuehelia grisea]|uniref:Uncharacterized protein n=1 Tax=Hohenbuehelia grisea TaxID=104357 RepID=A0ABR3JQL4_9AGAR
MSAYRGRLDPSVERPVIAISNLNATYVGRRQLCPRRPVVRHNPSIAHATTMTSTECIQLDEPLLDANHSDIAICAPATLSTPVSPCHSLLRTPAELSSEPHHPHRSSLDASGVATYGRLGARLTFSGTTTGDGKL